MLLNRKGSKGAHTQRGTWTEMWLGCVLGGAVCRWLQSCKHRQETLTLLHFSTGNNLAQKCFECWNAAVGADEGKNGTSANQCSSFTNDRK